MTSHVIAYRSLELLFGTHTFNFNCFFDDFNCVFTQIRCLSRVLAPIGLLLGVLQSDLGPHCLPLTFIKIASKNKKNMQQTTKQMAFRCSFLADTLMVKYDVHVSSCNKVR